MIRIPIRRIAVKLYATDGEFDHDRTTAVTAYRWLVQLQIRLSGSMSFDRDMAILDTGAPLNVVPQSVARKIHWQPLGSSLVYPPVGKDTSARPQWTPNVWDGIECDMGSANVVAIDWQDKKSSSRICRLTGKFARQLHTGGESARDRCLLLGANFLIDNGIALVLNGSDPAGDYLLCPDA